MSELDPGVYRSKAQEDYAKFLDAKERMLAARRRGDMDDAYTWMLRAADFLADMNEADRKAEESK